MTRASTYAATRRRSRRGSNTTALAIFGVVGILAIVAAVLIGASVEPDQGPTVYKYPEADGLEGLKLRSFDFHPGDGSILDQPSFKVIIANNGREAIRAVRFHATFKTPGRSVAWVDEYAWWKIAGGIEPGEVLIEKLKPNMFIGDWDDAAHADDGAVFELEIVEAETASGRKLKR